MMDGMGATIMGRNMFGPIRGEWDDSDWKGWWGDVPPTTAHVRPHSLHPRTRSRCEGGTTFTSSPTGSSPPTPRPRRLAGGRAISIAGGASCARQAIARRAGRRDRSSDRPGDPRFG